MEEVFLPIAICAMLFIGMPWLFLHYSTKFKAARGISQQDEQLLDDLYESARRLDARLESIERIIAADNPTWKDGRLTDRSTAGLTTSTGERRAERALGEPRPRAN